MTITTIQPNGANGIDTFIYALAGANFGTETYMYIGEANNGAGAYCRALLKFDLSGILSSDISTSSILYLRTCSDGYSSDYATNAPTYYIYHVLRDWVENQTTWTIFSTGNNWGTVGCSNTATDRENTVIATGSTVNNLAIDSEVAITFYNSEIKKYFGSTLNIIIQTNENNDMYPFHSSDSPTASYRPKLVITHEAATDIPNVKTVNGVANTDIKTMNGVPVNDIKSLQGLFSGEWLRKLDVIKKGGLWMPNTGLVTI